MLERFFMELGCSILTGSMLQASSQLSANGCMCSHGLCASCLLMCSLTCKPGCSTCGCLSACPACRFKQHVVNVTWKHFVYRALNGDYVAAIAALTSRAVVQGNAATGREGNTLPPPLGVVIT